MAESIQAEISRRAQKSLRLPTYAGKISYPTLVGEICGTGTSEGGGYYFVDGYRPTPAARALIETIGNAASHGLDPSKFGLADMDAKIGRLEKMASRVAEGGRAFEASPGELAVISSLFGQTGGTTAEDDAGRLGRAMDMIFDPASSPLPRVPAILDRETRHLTEAATLARDVEYALTDAWIAYAREMKFGNLEKFSGYELEKFASKEVPDQIHPKHFDTIIRDRLAEATRHFRAVSAMDKDGVMEFLSGLAPKHPQYARLQAARERYAGIVESGGWETVPADRMYPGGAAPLVKNLKRRLAREGFFEGTEDENFDAPLEDAIRAYRRHHQMEEGTATDDVFWRSLNVPARRRLEEIEANLRHWHRAMYEESPRYIYVNIPSFTVELWDEGRLVSSHRTVVGGTTRTCNPRTQEWERPNATHEMHSRISYVTFNPYWNVPTRIETDEYAPRMAADPTWLANSDFEYFTPKGGAGRVLRQRPGPNNALGKVKLIFPNRYNTYLHDTPRQQIFQYPVRAFSHGCIRVEGAFDFAREVLTLDGTWDADAVRRYFDTPNEHPVYLKAPVDVFIEYHTVTADEDGMPYFLADVYRKIRDEISPPTASDRKCSPIQAQQ